MNKGYSLVEMSIVLVIVSIIAGGVVKLLVTSEESQAEQITISRLNEIEKAIVAYANANNALPCPATMSDAVNTGSFGLSHFNCMFVAADGVTVSGYRIRFGLVPVRTLGLSDEYAFDGWGNRFRYASVRELAASANFINFAFDFGNLAPNTATFQILDASGNIINPQNSYVAPRVNNSIAYVILSHGKNGNGAVPFAGGAYPACPAGGLEEENCNGGIVYRDTFHNTSPSAYFDDFIRWKTYNQLRIDAGLAGNSAIEPIPLKSDYAHLEYVSNCNPTCSATDGIGPVGTGSGIWVPRSFNTVHFNFATNPLLIYDAPRGRFILSPGKYSFIIRAYYNTSIATTLSCQMFSEEFSSLSTNAPFYQLPANSNGHVVFTATSTATENTTYYLRCNYNPWTSGSTTFRKVGAVVSALQILITRHQN